MAKELVVLLVEDDDGHARLVKTAFKRSGNHARVERVDCLKDARDWMAETMPSLVLADLLLPDGRGINLLDNSNGEPAFPMVVMTSHGDEKVAVEAMKAGALDYVVKSPEAFREIPRVVRRAMREWGHIIKRRSAEEELKRLNGQLAEAIKKLERLANYDALTGVANRRNFMDSYANEWKRGRRGDSSLSLIMIDVDFFKAYNDTNGHQAGDECLKRLALLLKGALPRSGDFLARYGGEEFIVILPNTDAQGCCSVAEKLREAVERAEIPHKASEISEFVTISLGCAGTVPNKHRNPEALIATADEALYKAKGSGRNCCRIAEASEN